MVKSRRQRSEYDLLVETRKEYTNQLNSLLVGPIYDGVRSIWNSAKATYEDDYKENKTKPALDLLEYFQATLREIPKWSEEMITNEYERIKEVTHWNDPDDFDNLITAVFLSRTKILSQIKFSNKMSPIKLIIPTPKNFIHKVYISAGRRVFQTPFYFEDRPGKIEKYRMQSCLKLILCSITESIDATIQDLLPVREILKESFKARDDDDDDEDGGGYTSGDSGVSDLKNNDNSKKDQDGGGGNNVSAADIANLPRFDNDTGKDGYNSDVTAYSDYKKYSSDSGGSSDEDGEGKSKRNRASLQDLLGCENGNGNENRDERRDDRDSSGSDRDDERKDRDDRSDRKDRDQQQQSPQVRSVDLRKSVKISEDEIIPATPSNQPPLSPRSHPSPIIKPTDRSSASMLDTEPLFIDTSDDDEL